MSKRTLALLSTALCATIVAACSSESGESHASEASDRSQAVATDGGAQQDDAPASQADMAWRELTSSGPLPERISGESELDYFFRRVELSNLRRRELGLQFWDSYPDDPRRYSWLILAVHMVPYYAQDIQEWATQEADHLHPNGARIDTASRDAWQARYPELRDAFFASASVSDRQRRFMWFGELLQSLKQMREANARGEIVDPQPFLDHYVGFMSTFLAQFPDESAQGNELSRYRYMRTHLWQQVFETNREIFSWTPESALAFLERVEPYTDEESGMIGILSDLRETIVSTGELPAPAIRVHGMAFDPDVVDARRAWGSLNIRARAVSDTPEAAIVSAYNRVIHRRMTFEIGQNLWDQYPDRAYQFFWATGLIRGSAMPYYVSSFVDGFRRVAENRSEEIIVDEVAQAAGRTRFAELRAEFFADPDASSERKADWIAAELAPLERKLTGGRPGVGGEGVASPEEIQQYLDIVRLLHTDFDSDATVANLLHTIVIFPGRFGLSLDDGSLDDFLAFFRSSDTDELNAVFELHAQRLAWKETPIDLTLPVFNQEGETLTLSDLRGKIVYVDSWATWCSGCVAAMPELHETYLEYQDKGFEFVSLVTSSDRKGVQRVLDTYELTWPLVYGNGVPNVTDTVIDESDPAYRQLSLYYTVIDRDGTVYEYHDRKARNLREILDEMLAAEDAGAE